jgi:hypothetical protein
LSLLLLLLCLPDALWVGYLALTADHTSPRALVPALQLFAPIYLMVACLQTRRRGWRAARVPFVAFVVLVIALQLVPSLGGA